MLWQATSLNGQNATHFLNFAGSADALAQNLRDLRSGDEYDTYVRQSSSRLAKIVAMKTMVNTLVRSPRRKWNIL